MRDRHFQWMIVTAWVLLNGWLLWHNGIVTTGESEKYIREARFFLQTHHPSAPSFWLYTTEIALLACCLKFNTGFIFAVAVHLMLNLSATLFFNRTIAAFFSHKGIALSATLLLLAAYPYQEFNTFLQTESIFFSLTLIGSCLLIHPDKRGLNRPFFLCGVFALICLTRPTGMLFVPPATLFILLNYGRSWSVLQKLTVTAVAALVFLFALNAALGTPGAWDFILPFTDENIICGVSTLPEGTHGYSSGNAHSLVGLADYIIHHFPQFLKLAALRSLAFFGLYRSYYSRIHNFYLLAYFNLILLSALFSVGYWKRRMPLTLMYLGAVILLTWLTVMITCDDWHNRFYLSVFPFLLVLGAGCFKSFKKTIST